MSLVGFIQGRFKALKNDVGAAKNVVQRDVVAPAARVVSNDIAAPVVRTVQAAPRVIMPVAHTVVNNASKAYDQVNTLDNGRTFKQRTPTNTRSVVGQVTHNGATNFAGDLAKPLAQFPLDAGTVIYNKAVAPHFNLPQQNIQHNPLLGGAARFVGANGSVKQTVGSGLQTALTIGTAGTARMAEAGAADLIPQVVPKVIARVAPKVIGGSLIGAGFSGAAGISNGDSARQILTHDIPTGAVVGGTLPIAGEIAGKGAAVVKNVAGKATPLDQSGHIGGTKPGDEPQPKGTTPKRNADGTIPLSADALKQSKVADAPTHINDALLAKQAKLQQIKDTNGGTTTADTAVAPTTVSASTVKVAPSPQTDVSKFADRLSQEERTAPIADTLQQQGTHNVLHNQDVLDATQANINKNEDAALQFAKRGNTTEANATALQLINKYLDNGEYEKAGDLVKSVNPRFTRQGQQTQILAAYSRLTPTGAVRFAQHEVDNAVSKTGAGKRIPDETNNTAKIVQKTTNDVADQLNTELKTGKLGTQKPAAGGTGEGGTNTASTAPKPGNTPEERLGARIKASEPGKTKGPDPVTDMVNTLHKVAKEVLPADEAKAIPRDPMQLIGQAVKGEGNYQDVYAKAKAIVMDRYKDNPEAQAELEKYFTDDPKRTYAQSQVNAGVQSGLKGVDLGALVKQHYTNVDEVGKDLKTKLIERAGLNEADATQLSGDIQKRYGELVQARKDSIIKQMFGDKPTPKQLSAADKIFQYENLGALSKDELRPLVGEKLGIPSLSEDAIKQISDHAKAIQEMPEGVDRTRATAQMMKFIAEQVPQGKMQGVLSVWKAGLLSGPLTQAGNFASNATFGGLQKISDAPAAALDTVLSKFTGKRTKTFTTRGIGSGTAEGVQKGIGTMRTGLDERNFGGDKFEQHGELNFKNPVIQNVFGKTSNLVFRGMSAADQPFFYAQAKNSLNDMAIAEAKNRGLSGAESDAFVKNLVANPTQQMAERAQHEAWQGVLGQESKIASSLTRLTQEHPTLQIIAPFIKVPTNFLTRTLDYTPVGAMKAAVKVMVDRKNGEPFDQRAFVNAIGQATTGSAILYMGAEMANNGVLSGAYPTDPKEQQRWKAEGITPNSIHIGSGKTGKWISLNYLGPLGMLLGAGKSYHDAASAGNNGWTQALSSFGQNLTGQSFLTGLSSFTNALQDPQRYATSLKNSTAGSVVPAWVRTLANALDPQQRQASSIPQTIQSDLPLARNRLQPKTDVYGNNLPQRTSPGQLVLDPTKPSNDLGTNNPVIREVSRLHNVDPNSSDLQVTPTPPTSLNIEGKTVKLNSGQKYELQNAVGQAVQKQWGDLIKTPEYKALDDAGKAKALSNLRSDVTTLTERQYVVDNNLGTYTKSPSTAVQALAQGNTVLSDYATKTQNAGGANAVILNKSLDSNSRTFLTKYNALNAKERTAAASGQNDYEYKLAQAQYANNVANSSLSTAQKIKAEAGLAKDKVGADYPKNVRDLYGLSNDELSNYLASNESGVDKGKLADQILAYGDAQAAAGVITKNKFRTSKGVVTLGDSADGSTPSQRSAAGKAKKMPTVAIPKVNNPYKSAGSKQQKFKQTKLPTIKSAVTHHSYKTPTLKTNISAKLRKA